MASDWCMHSMCSRADLARETNPSHCPTRCRRKSRYRYALRRTTLTEVLGQQLIVENRPGINSVVGAEVVARSAPDGYTFLMMSSTFLTTPILTRSTPYDPLRDFTGVTLIAWLPQVMVVHPSLPARSIREFIALGKRIRIRLIMRRPVPARLAISPPSFSTGRRAFRPTPFLIRATPSR